MSTLLQDAAANASAESGQNATRRLAVHAAKLRHEAIPAELVELTERCVLDTLGVPIGASSLSPEAKLLEKCVRGLGGRPESSILGFGGKVAASAAVMINVGRLNQHLHDHQDVQGHRVAHPDQELIDSIRTPASHDHNTFRRTGPEAAAL